MEQPFGSKIAIGVGDRGEDVVTIPGSGGGAKVLGVAFTGLWLLGWMAGIVAVVYFALVRESEPVPPWAKGFLLVWLGIWVAGGLMVWRGFAYLLLATWGEEKLAFGSDALVHIRRLFGRVRVQVFPIEQVSGFRHELIGVWSSNQFVARIAGRGEVVLCTMYIGKRAIPVAAGATPEEGRWLTRQLNTLLERRKR